MLLWKKNIKYMHQSYSVKKHFHGYNTIITNKVQCFEANLSSVNVAFFISLVDAWWVKIFKL